MNRKPYNQVEEQIKNAAQNWEADFDEQAWKQMEKMLDEKDDRKRPVIWWIWLLPFTLGVATIAYFYFNNSRPIHQSSININKTLHSKPLPKGNANTVKLPNDALSNSTPVVPGNKSQEGISLSNKKNINIHDSKSYSTVNEQEEKAGKPATDGSFSHKKVSKKVNSKAKYYISNSNASEEGKAELQNRSDDSLENAKVEITNPINQIAGEDKLTAKDSVSKKIDSSQNKQLTAIKDSLPLQKNNNPKIIAKDSKFYFSLYGGAEGSGVNFPGVNKFNFRTGISMGYYLNKKLSLQAGFFTGTKKYIAGKNDYKAKPGSYWSMVDITKVDARCLVYEIPVSIKYDFASKHNWKSFAGAGISSFIMKKEDYAYDYLYYNMPQHANASYKGNQHWFSVLRIFGGVERKLGKTISGFLQPGIAIPLAGVGEGQIKLFSSEILLGIKFRPQKKK